MEILSVELKNFLTVGQATISLNNKGLVLIQGENKDDPSSNSNGAGKSSLVDGLSWCLYGVTARNVTGDAVINDTAKKDCMVQVSIKDGDTVYLITRYRKDGTHKNATYVVALNGGAGVGVPLHKATEKETQALIESIIGSSVEVFRAAIYAGQEAMPDLPGMTDKQLKLLIEEGAGVERLSRAYEKVRADLNDAKNKWDSCSGVIDNINRNLERAKVTAADNRLKHGEFESGREDRVKGKLREALPFKREIETLQASLATMDETGLREQLAAVEGKLTGKAANDKEIQRQQQAINQLNSQVAHANAQVTVCANIVRKIQSSIADAPNAMKEPCSECGKAHTPEEEAEYLAHLKGQLKPKALDYRAAKDKADKLAADLKTAQEALQAFQSSLPDVSDLINQQKALWASIAELDALKARIQNRTRDLRTKMDEVKRLQTDPSPFLSVIESWEKTVNDLEDELLNAKNNASEFEKRYELLLDAAAVFGPAGVRAHILDTVTPFLNQRTSDYLAELSDGNIFATWTTLTRNKSGDLKEKFSIEVTNTKGAKSFAGLSGGEKRKVRLATAMALQDLVASRATKSFNLWVGDEIDNALDTAGLERLMGILNTKAKERGTVLVISHSDLTDWIDNICTVTKENGYSTVAGVLV